MLRRVDRILIRVPQLESAGRYYQDVLGMTLVRQDQRLATFRCADEPTEIVLHTDPDLPEQGVYFLVEDVRALHAKRTQLKLTFIAGPTPVSRGFRATVKDPFGHVLLLLDRTAEQSVTESTIEDAKPAAGLFRGVEVRVGPKRDRLIALYEKLKRTADDLPYTPHFESLYNDYCAAYSDTKPTREETWRHLLNIRKSGRLPKLGEARSPAPQVTDEDREALRHMLGKDIGKRDRLPYTRRFDELVDAFNRSQKRPLSPHLVWRLVATLAK